MSQRKFPLDQLIAADEEYIGFCLSCGAEKDCCEPDAREYQCDACGKLEVYGASEIIQMNLVSDGDIHGFTE